MAEASAVLCLFAALMDLASRHCASSTAADAYLKFPVSFRTETGRL